MSAVPGSCCPPQTWGEFTADSEYLDKGVVEQEGDLEITGWASRKSASFGTITFLDSMVGGPDSYVI